MGVRQLKTGRCETNSECSFNQRLTAQKIYQEWIPVLQTPIGHSLSLNLIIRDSHCSKKHQRDFNQASIRVCRNKSGLVNSSIYQKRSLGKTEALKPNRVWTQAECRWVSWGTQPVNWTFKLANLRAPRVSMRIVWLAISAIEVQLIN